MLQQNDDFTPEERRMIDRENRERRQFIRKINPGSKINPGHDRRRRLLFMILIGLAVIVAGAGYWLTHSIK